MSKKKKTLLRVIVGLVAFVAVMLVFSLSPLKSFKDFALSRQFGRVEFYAYVIPFIAIYFLVGYDVVFKAVRNLFNGKLFDENFLMTVATIGAIALCDLPEAVAVMLFYQIGELFQGYAVGKSRRSISALMDICPQTACVLRNGEEQTVFPEELTVGELIVVRAGERVAVDSVVYSGSSSMDTSSLTGESVPVSVAEGDSVLSGSINLSGAITLRAVKEFSDSTVSKILDLVENASSKKAKAENFITKFARYYTPAVVITAVLLAVVPSLIDGEWSTWVERALTFLVVSCPCALVISVPMSFFGGIGCASKNGVLIKGGSYVEKLADCGVVVMDKTGTLTHGSFEVTDVFPKDKKEEILTLAALAESGSLHPVARSVLRAAPKVDASSFTVTEIAGKGVTACDGNTKIDVGSLKFLKESGVDVSGIENNKSAVYLAKNGIFVGYIVIEDAVKDNAKDVISALKKGGVKTVMLTGDNPACAKAVAEAVGVDEWHAGMLPQDKVAHVEQLIAEKPKGKTLCFIGDGINDAPVLSVADVGLSMGGIGSDAAIEASDVVIVNDDLSSVLRARRIAVKTMRIVKQNVVFALGVKLAVLILSALGITGMWLAVFADVGVAVIAILNAMRALVDRE